MSSKDSHFFGSLKDDPKHNAPLEEVESWYHYDQGFYFVRRVDGSVSIEQYLTGEPGKGKAVWRIHCPRDIWISIIGSMSATHKNSFDFPYQFHMGEKPEYKKDNKSEVTL